LRIDDEQDYVGAFDSGRDLLLDFARQVVDVRDADAARVDDFKVAVVLVHQVRHSIPRHACLIVNNGDPFSRQPI
jgi:hypothetical protein